MRFYPSPLLTGKDKRVNAEPGVKSQLHCFRRDKSPTCLSSIRFLILLLLYGCIFFGNLPPVVNAAEHGRVLFDGMEINPLETGVVITIRTNGEIKEYKTFTLDDPARIVFDFFDIESPYRTEQSIPVNTPWLKRIRHYGEAGKLRVVLDTADSYLSDYFYKTDDNGIEITVAAQATDSVTETIEKPPEPAAAAERSSDKPAPVAIEPTPDKPAPIAAESAPEVATAKKMEKKPDDLVLGDDIDPLSVVGDRLDFLESRGTGEKFTLSSTISAAIVANLQLRISGDEVKAAQAVKKARQTGFFPTLSADYTYRRNDAAGVVAGDVITAEDEFRFETTVEQPVFSGFSVVNQYKIASLDLNIAKLNKRLTRQDIIFEAKTAYFNLLKAQKLRAIAQQTVDQIAAQREVSRNFYEVGMSPLNDLLQSEVELANAKQELITAGNNQETVRSQFNTLLRRPINAAVDIEDVLTFEPFGRKLDWCQETAEQKRLEVKLADMEIDVAEKQVDLSKKDFYPSINLQGTYFRTGSDWYADGGQGVRDPNGWFVGAVASWDFWEWGKTVYGKREKMSRLSQAQTSKEDLLDRIRLQVKQTYLANVENEVNIHTLRKAIRQAEENYRIFQERYKEQVTTSTDVLIAQTLLSRTQTNYYTALYDFKIAKAALFRAMGLEVLE